MCLYVFVCVSVILLSISGAERSNASVRACVGERERETERDRVHVWEGVCVILRERERVRV